MPLVLDQKDAANLKISQFEGCKLSFLE